MDRYVPKQLFFRNDEDDLGRARRMPSSGGQLLEVEDSMMPRAAATIAASETVLRGLTCTHPRMCCPNNVPPVIWPCTNKRCNHYYCPDCGLSWDDGSEGL